MVETLNRPYHDPDDKRLVSLLYQQEAAWRWGKQTDLETANEKLAEAVIKHQVTPAPQQVNTVRDVFAEQKAAFRSGNQNRIEQANEQLLKINQDVLADKDPTTP